MTEFLTLFFPVVIYSSLLFLNRRSHVKKIQKTAKENGVEESLSHFSSNFSNSYLYFSILMVSAVTVITPLITDNEILLRINPFIMFVINLSLGNMLYSTLRSSISAYFDKYELYRLNRKYSKLPFMEKVTLSQDNTIVNLKHPKETLGVSIKLFDNLLKKKKFIDEAEEELKLLESIKENKDHAEKIRIIRASIQDLNEDLESEYIVAAEYLLGRSKETKFLNVDSKIEKLDYAIKNKKYPSSLDNVNNNYFNINREKAEKEELRYIISREDISLESREKAIFLLEKINLIEEEQRKNSNEEEVVKATLKTIENMYSQ